MQFHTYDHVIDMPNGHVLACDSAFTTSGKLNGKIVKLKETALENGEERNDKDKVIAHVWKCDE